MSSHREAPEISNDPAADNTDLYAFVSPDRPDTVTILANFIPFQNPQGGPNFYEFAEDVRYDINIANRGDAKPGVTYRFRFSTTIRNPDTFLYNTGPITSLTSAAWNRPQTYTVTRFTRSGESTVLGKGLPVPPVNVGVRSTPNYEALAASAVCRLRGGRQVFAGQRAEAFFVDLGSIFDLAALRPFNPAHLIPLAAAPGLDGTGGLNVHTIALQVPITDLTRGGGRPTDVADPTAVIGIWATASRRTATIRGETPGRTVSIGPWVQVSRLGNPLFNEVVVPMSRKDEWNAEGPDKDSEYAGYVADPELARLLPVLYPGVFPNLSAYRKPRADLAAILLTGIPTGVVPGFQNFTGPTQADLLRLNVAVPPSATSNPLGLVAGDPAGFPNGRRVGDDVTTIELRAVAGLTIPLVDSTFTPDAAVAGLSDGSTNTNPPTLATFPYLGTPIGGYQAIPGSFAS